VLKFFLYYGPNDPVDLNQRKHMLVRSIGEQCRAQGTTFLFEPIVYDRAVPDGTSEAYALLKPELVRRAVETFVNPDYRIDILKIEIPVTLDYLEGYGAPAMSRRDAEAAVVAVSEAAGAMPFLYLSAGVPFERFVEGLAFCKRSSGKADGFMCGRALWSDAIGVFGAEGPNAMARWMETTGRERLARMGEAIA
jgi:tagatose 1,6-diphosphate aldolase